MGIFNRIIESKLDISKMGFVDIVNFILDNIKEDNECKSVFLMKTDSASDLLRKVTGYAYDKADEAKYDNVSLTVSEQEAGAYINRESKVNQGREELFVPIFLRMNPVMYLYAEIEANADTGRIVEAALVIQSIATQKNFEESLTVSYRLMEEVLDYIPTGVAVLDRDEKNVLLINKEAEKSRAIQRAMGKALSKYSTGGEQIISDVYDEESELWFDVYFTSVTWVDDRPVIMCSAIDTTQKVLNRKRIEYQANNDYLTGLYNRMKCEKDLKELVDKATENNEKGAVLFIDLDNFKHINDGLGHQYGDLLLQEIAKMLSNIPQLTGSCYRIGGDEFVVIIKPEFYKDIDMIADLIIEKFNIPWKLIDKEYDCTMSMGIAVFPEEGIDIKALVKNADTAMYEAKNNGKNRYFHFKDLI